MLLYRSFLITDIFCLLLVAKLLVSHKMKLIFTHEG